jgi:molybdopterin synthase catalytic subunit
MDEGPIPIRSGASSSPAAVFCTIEPAPLDLARLRATVPELGHTGGYVCFEGIVRNINHGLAVTRLEYEAFESLAVKEMMHIADHAAERFALAWVRVIHRVGVLNIGETAVIIQVLSRHRREAFEGCHFIIDQIKFRVPIWKREVYEDGSAAWTRCHEHGAPAFLTIEGD